MIKPNALKKGDKIAYPNDMFAYYSTEQIEKYGIVGIELLF